MLMTEVQFLAPICSLTCLSVLSSCFDAVFISRHDITIASASTDSTLPNDIKLWSWMPVSLMILCLVRAANCWRLYRSRKITAVDFYLAAVYNAFTMMQTAAHGVLLIKMLNENSRLSILNRITALECGFVMNCLAWSVIWSRTVRIGWKPVWAWTACALGSTSVFLALVHPSALHVARGIALALAQLSVYETYKIHFYRDGLVTCHRVTQAAYALLWITCACESFGCGGFPVAGWCAMRAISLAFLAEFMTRAYMNISVEVNQHKY